MASQRSAALLIVLLAVTSPALGKVFTRCELVVELRAQGFPNADLPDWVCLIEAESSRNTAAKGGPNTNGSYDWGLYQVNDGFWCSTTATAGKDCNVRCENLLDNDITDDSNCAKIIYNRHGFDAWYGWLSKCQGALPDISAC